MVEEGALPERFPWRALMGFGLGRLRLPSGAFWAMTPRELLAAADGLGLRAAAPLPRASLEALMRRFPDEASETGETP
jgi:uncharacterized phage protein (TIGR02216 family)